MSRPLSKSVTFFTAVRQIFRVLDGFAIHVTDVKRAVRPDSEVDRAKPNCSGDARNSFVGYARFATKRHAVRREHIVMDEISRRLAREGIAAITNPQRRAIVNRHSARARDVAAVIRGGDDVRAQRIKPASRPVIGTVLDDLREAKVRVAFAYNEAA